LDLVLGILSLVCFTIFAAIPGVICGHKALSKIKHSNGTLTGQGLPGPYYLFHC
jgi:hypothetical protein